MRRHGLPRRGQADARPLFLVVKNGTKIFRAGSAERQARYRRSQS